MWEYAYERLIIRLASSLAVQQLGLHALTVEDLGSIPGWGTKIPQAIQSSQKKKNQTIEFSIATTKTIRYWDAKSSQTDSLSVAAEWKHFQTGESQSLGPSNSCRLLTAPNKWGSARGKEAGRAPGRRRAGLETRFWAGALWQGLLSRQGWGVKN